MNDKKPDWLKIRVSYSPEINEVSEMLNALNLHTV